MGCSDRQHKSLAGQSGNRPLTAKNNLLDEIKNIIILPLKKMKEKHRMGNLTYNMIMNNGTPYYITPCTEHSVDFCKDQIISAVKSMSSKSRRFRFGLSSPSLSDETLECLTTFDNFDRFAWCATIVQNGNEKGIGLSRYVRLAEENGVAEFALTVVDEFHGQGIGIALLNKLLLTAKENDVRILRGFINSDNRKMLSLCKKYHGKFIVEEPGSMIVDLPVREKSNRSFFDNLFSFIVTGHKNTDHNKSKR